MGHHRAKAPAPLTYKRARPNAFRTIFLPPLCTPPSSLSSAAALCLLSAMYRPSSSRPPLPSASRLLPSRYLSSAAALCLSSAASLPLFPTSHRSDLPRPPFSAYPPPPSSASSPTLLCLLSHGICLLSPHLASCPCCLLSPLLAYCPLPFISSPMSLPRLLPLPFALPPHPHPLTFFPPLVHHPLSIIVVIYPLPLCVPLSACICS